MRAELIIDIDNLGTEVGKALGRDEIVYPALGTVSELWKALGLDVDAIHIVAPHFTGDSDTTFASRHLHAWWTTEQAFLADNDFDVTIVQAPNGTDGPVGLDELVTTRALRRSDELAGTQDVCVVVMSNSADVSPAVTHARGVPVRIAGTVIHDSGLAHTRIDLSWMGMLKNRFTAISLPEVELRGGRPWSGDIAVSTPYSGTEGRDLDLAELPSFAESAAVFDPAHFVVRAGSETTSPRDAGIAAVVHTLGLGSLLHIEDTSLYTGSPAQIAAVIYRFAADHPDIPLVLATTRPSMIALSSDLRSYAIKNPGRVIRLCLTERDTTFDEAAFATRSAATRIVIEQTLTTPLFDGDAAVIDVDQLEGVSPSQGALADAPSAADVASPTLTLYANPNTIREVSETWREKNKRRFLMLGATGAEATPADSSEGIFLPISLGGCTDFLVRRPELRPGCIVEGVLHRDGGRWLIVSDPIERRRHARPMHAETPAPDVDASAEAA